MPSEPTPTVIISAMVRERDTRSDEQVLDELRASPELADEEDPCWSDPAYWMKVSYPYLALAEVARARRLRAAVGLLLDRACFGDPGECMRGLRHDLEAIMAPDWAALADICIAAAERGRPGTTLWAVDQLLVLEDERARPLLTKLATSEHDEIARTAEAALQRLDKPLARST